MDNKYTKLSALVGNEFTVNGVGEYVWKAWDNAERKMKVSQSYEEGYKKVYPVETDKGSLDLSASQLGQILEAVQYAGKADLVGRTVAVKSNGKSGMDIRYFFNAKREATKPTGEAWEEARSKLAKPDEVIEDIDEEPVSLDSIPF